MGLTLWVATTRRDGPACQRRSETGWGRLWERRSVEKSFGLSHLAWKSRPHRGIPTFPQSRRRCSLNLKTDISCALKSGHFNLLTTARVPGTSGADSSALHQDTGGPAQVRDCGVPRRKGIDLALGSLLCQVYLCILHPLSRL